MADHDPYAEGASKPSTIIVKLAELRKDVGALQSHDREHSERLSKLTTTAVEHRMRLENGVKVFSDQKARLATVEDRISPQPPSVLRIVGLTIGIVSLGAGSLWGLSNMLRDRPTSGQIEKIIDSHDDSGHRAVRDDINNIQKTQALQSKAIDDLGTEQKAVTRKIDTLLDRVPAPTPRRRRRNRGP